MSDRGWEELSTHSTTPSYSFEEFHIEEAGPGNEFPGTDGTRQVSTAAASSEVGTIPGHPAGTSSEIRGASYALDLNMLSEDLRLVMMRIRAGIRGPAFADASASYPPTSFFHNAALMPTPGRQALDPRKHLSWLLLGYNRRQGAYIGEPVEIKAVMLKADLQSLGQCLLTTLQDMLGSRLGRSLQPALTGIAQCGIAFLSLALRRTIGMGPMLAHHIVIGGEFQADSESAYGVTPNPTPIQFAH